MRRLAVWGWSAIGDSPDRPPVVVHSAARRRLATAIAVGGPYLGAVLPDTRSLDEFLVITLRLPSLNAPHNFVAVGFRRFH